MKSKLLLTILSISLSIQFLHANWTYRRTIEILPADKVDVSSLGTENEPIVPTTYALHQNYPNPFNPITTV